MEAGKGVTRKLARHAATLRYETLPPALVELTKQCVLDTLGVTIGASTLAPEARILADYVKDLGGKAGERRCSASAERRPRRGRLFVNGSLGHMLDYDDLGESGHPSIATMPVALALAEKQGGVSGRELITAIAAGMDVMTRISRAIDVPDWTMTEGWFATQLHRLRRRRRDCRPAAEARPGADGERARHRLQPDERQPPDGRGRRDAHAFDAGRLLRPGRRARGGTRAARHHRLEGRSSRGVTASSGPTFAAASPTGTGSSDGLGAKFPLLEKHGFKVWPACGYTRTTNASTLAMREQHGLKPEDIESITIVGGTGGTQQLCEPLAAKRRPKVSIDGKFSIPFTTAVMMAKGNVTLRDYTEEGLSDPAVLAMADRVSYRPGTQPVTGKGGSQDVSKTSVEIVTRDGRRFEHRSTSVPGDPKNPVSWERFGGEIPRLRVVLGEAGRARRRQTARSR